ncbi:MAG: hypothetical protein ACLUD0_05720 [Eubacterium ramulus]
MLIHVEGISQEQIAEAFEVTQQNISYLIRAAIKIQKIIGRRA